MILIDTALAAREAEGRPIRVGMIGAGFMARGTALQILKSVPGMKLSAICNRTLERAVSAYTDFGVEDVVTCDSPQALNAALEAGKPAVTQDPLALVSSPHIDVVLEATGALEETIPSLLATIENGKHLVLMNAEIDGTIGPLLKRKADAAGVIYTNVDGDQPGVIMTLYRYVKSIGMTPRVCGNIKGLQDCYRTPTTQAGFAAQWSQDPAMVTSFADGTKMTYEQALVGNATGMTVPKRGMNGFEMAPGTHVEEAMKYYDIEELRAGPGIVDYVVGASPKPGVFVFATNDHPMHQYYLQYYKMGDGPLYCFYTPYHLCHFEVPLTIARAVLFKDASIAPQGLHVEVIATAKRDLKAGEVIDQLGGYTVYGEAEAASVTAQEGLLPIGVAIGCTLKRDIPKDQALCYADVDLPPGRLLDQLRVEQAALFG